MGYRIIVCNNKGGAGKSALSAAIAAALARLGFDVCCVDMDPQGNLTRRMGYEEGAWPAERPTIADALRLKSQHPIPIAEIAVPCAWEHSLAERITVIPSVPLTDGDSAMPALEQRGKEGGLENGANYRLRRQLDGYDENFDFTIIDVPPGLGHLTDMALAAGDVVVIVLQPEFDYVQGALRMNVYVEFEREDLGRPDLRVIGVIVTNVKNTATDRAQLKVLPDLFGELLWEPQVPHRATWSAANSDAIPIELVKGWQAAELADMFEKHARKLCAAVGVAVPAQTGGQQ